VISAGPADRPARDCVVILAPENDIHAIAVARAVAADYPAHSVFVVDTARFPTELNLSLRPGGWSLSSNDWRIESDRVSGLWHRRPAPPAPDEAILDVATRRFARQESGLAIDCMSVELDYRVVNPIDRHFLANHKPYQLRVAEACGLNVPAYDVTNDPDRVAGLIDKHGDNAFIFKTLGPPVHVISETRYLNREHLTTGSAMRLAPVIYQRAIKRRCEYRVAFVGERIFVHELLFHNETAAEYPDWRLDLTIESRESSLPEDVLEKTRALMKALGLYYGAIDFIEDDTGTIWFLEVNPQGQFLFNQIDADTPICGAMAELLATPARSAAFGAGSAA
jgi:glutathione synthase/RimK-type ligase-like ATP-grasp enzyme